MKEIVQHLNDHRTTLRMVVAEAVACAGDRNTSRLVSVRFAVPNRDVVRDFLAVETNDAFHWQEPSRNVAMVGLGRIETIEVHGAKRFAEASRRSRELFESLHVVSLPGMQADGAESLSPSVGFGDESNGADPRGPLLLGGFSFYDTVPDAESPWSRLGPGRLVLPELLLVRRDGQTWATRTCRIQPGADVESCLEGLCADISTGLTTGDPTPGMSLVDERADEQAASGPEIHVRADRAHDQYRGQVEAALAEIEAGKFEKVVLARSLHVTSDHGFELASFIATLTSMYPSCATVAVRQGDDLFISATPEKLVALAGCKVSTAAVAGSAPRGRSLEEEEGYSLALLRSEKEQVEHRVVRRAICKALEPLCGEIDGPAEPQLLKLEGIQHLETPLIGELAHAVRQSTRLLDLVGTLHPTPAVGGAPSAVAVDWLERFEALDRGWYAGPVGYVDGNGDGEFRVALRSALLHGNHAQLFAGAGVVAGSDPQAELAETRLKLRALLAPLTEI